MTDRTERPEEPRSDVPAPVVDEIVDHLESEVAHLHRRTLVAAIVWVVLAIVVVVYMRWLGGAIAEATEPPQLAQFTVNEVKRSLPEVRETLQKTLAENVPEVIQSAMSMVIEQTIPRLRKEGEALFSEHARQIAGLGVTLATDAFETVLRDHGDELRARSESEPGELTNAALMTNLDRLVSRELEKKTSDQPVETVGYKLDRSATALRNIDARLKQLASGERLSRQDELGRRFIGMWWQSLRRSGEDDRPMEPIKK